MGFRRVYGGRIMLWIAGAGVPGRDAGAWGEMGHMTQTLAKWSLSLV
jgi:hypothetical protein